MTLKTEEAIKIAEQIQKDITDDKVSTLNILRKYYSLVTLIGKNDEVEWALNELNGYTDTNINKIPYYRIVRHNQNKNKCVVIENSCSTIEVMIQSNRTITYNCVKNQQSGFITKKNSAIDVLNNTINVEPLRFLTILQVIATLIYTKTQQILIEIKVLSSLYHDLYLDIKRFRQTS